VRLSRASTLAAVLFALACLAAVAPLWAGAELPLVDLPQHLHLISVLQRLEDPSTLYPEWFAARGQLTPYLGYYTAVGGLSRLMPLEAANRLFLSAYVAGLALSLAFLLRTLGRQPWAAALALPFAYGDSLAWGFINYCAALPLAVLACALFVKTLVDAPRRRAWGAGMAVTLLAVLLMHVQAFAFLALALPALLLTTRVPEDAPGLPLRARLVPRLPALASVVPGVGLFFAWVVLRAGAPAEVEAGAPWKAWGPMLSPQNLGWKSFAQNREDLLSLLANQLQDGSDRAVLGWVAGALGLAWAMGLLAPPEDTAGRWTGLPRLALLAGLALGLYFLLPFDIRGYMYYLNPRYAHLAAALCVVLVPTVRPKAEVALAAAGLAVALALAVPLWKGYAAFSGEAAGLRQVTAAAQPKARTFGLVFNAASRVATHPVYLHAAARVAREQGGYANFSFALTPHSPVKYARPPPPTTSSEWRPQQFNYATMGPSYDHFLVKGPPPERLFGPLLGSELEVVARAGDVALVRRR
jgi:hypothetical protein